MYWYKFLNAAKMISKLYNLFSFENPNYWGERKTLSFHTEHKAQTNALSPRSDTQTYQKCKCKMHVFLFVILNVDANKRKTVV